MPTVVAGDLRPGQRNELGLARPRKERTAR